MTAHIHLDFFPSSLSLPLSRHPCFSEIVARVLTSQESDLFFFLLSLIESVIVEKTWHIWVIWIEWVFAAVVAQPL